MNEKDGGPAFPPNAGWRDNDPNANGMTLRDYFAAKAMQGELSCQAADFRVAERHLKAFAKRCYCIADAMLRERAK